MANKYDDSKNNKETLRSQEFRKMKGKIAVQKYDDFRNDFFENFGGAEGYAKTIDFDTSKRTCILPISTRGVGLSLFETASKLAYLAPQIPPPIHALHRTGLAAVTVAVAESCASQPSLVVDETLAKTILPTDLVQAVKNNNKHLTCVTSIVKQIGPVLAGNVEYQPRITNEPNHGIHIRNLRDYVVRMSSVDTPARERVQAHRENFIPGAEWIADLVPLEMPDEPGIAPALVPDVDSIRIRNPDEIIPARYGVVEILEDQRQVSLYLERIERKHKRYVGTLQYMDRGSESQLVSTMASTIRIDPERQALSGDAEEWHCTVPIPDASCLLGSLSLLGEYNADDNSDVRFNHTRSKVMASQVYNISWRQLLQATT